MKYPTALSSIDAQTSLVGLQTRDSNLTNSDGLMPGSTNQFRDVMVERRVNIHRMIWK